MKLARMENKAQRSPHPAEMLNQSSEGFPRLVRVLALQGGIHNHNRYLADIQRSL